MYNEQLILNTPVERDNFTPVHNLWQKAARIGACASLVVGLGVVGAVGEQVAMAEHNPASADTTYPWDDAPKISSPPAADNITWGYSDKATCDGKSSDADCSSATIGGFYFRDQWGNDLRNCTSYAAWRINKEFGVDLNYWGNATNWDDKAQAVGYAVNSTPEPGDLAIWEGTVDAKGNKGPGHVAFVESVNQDGSVNIAQYNRNLDGRGSLESNRRADHYIDINGEGRIWGSSTTTPDTGGGLPKDQNGNIPYAAVPEGAEMVSTEGHIYTKVGGAA